MQSDANIRSGPGASHDVLKTWPAGRRVLVYGEVKGEAYNGSTQWYQVAVPPEQSLFVHSSFIKKQADVLPVDKAPYTGRWFDVNLTQQVIVAYLGTSPAVHGADCEWHEKESYRCRHLPDILAATSASGCRAITFFPTTTTIWTQCRTSSTFIPAAKQFMAATGTTTSGNQCRTGASIPPSSRRSGCCNGRLSARKL